MTRKVTCIAIDDEPIALSIIAQFCQRHGGLELATFSEPEAGREAILRIKPDIVFLDIELGNVSGLHIARELPAESSLVFTTAYTEYALDGFDLDAVDYLHKPFSYDRFVKAVERALRRMDAIHGQWQAQTIVVKQEYASIPIAVAEILYIEAMENYVKIYRETASCVMSRMSMKSVMELLPAHDFVRIHRSYVVAKDKVLSFTRRNLLLKTGIELPIGRLYVDETGRLLQTS